jgi:ornithine cyclodeaminase/alanine dehydrogenase-like protein (mu-crystallin family)
MPLILSEKDLAPLYRDPSAMDGLLKIVQESLTAHSRGEVRGQVRVETSLTDPKRKFRIMTAAVPGAGQAMRINALFTGAKDAAFHLLFGEPSGDLLAIVAGRELNVWRTGAPSGVASRYLAPREAKTLGLLGSGRQARGQLAAIKRALPALRQVRVFSPNEAHRVSFAKEMSAWLGLDVQAANSPREALQDAPIVGLATSSRSKVLDADWVSPGALVISITSGQLAPELVARSRVIVSWREEVLEGESPREPYRTMIAQGSWSADKIAGELGEVVLGKISARENESETVVFECAGMPVCDTAATAWAYRWATERGAGTSFSLA